MCVAGVSQKGRLKLSNRQTNLFMSGATGRQALLLNLPPVKQTCSDIYYKHLQVNQVGVSVMIEYRHNIWSHI